MATVLGITRPRAAGDPVVTPGKHPKAILEAEKGTRLVIPYAPQGSDRTDLADTWERVDRPGRRPLLLHIAKRLPSMTLTLTLGHADAQAGIEGILDRLEKLGEADERVVLSNMSPRERGPWRITDLAVNATARQEGTNRITRATANLTLTAASDPLSRRGPLSGGKRDGKGGKVKRYTVKKGDTLRRIAAKPSIYGNPDAWQRLAKANGIKKPSAPLKAGRVLKVPR